MQLHNVNERNGIMVNIHSEASSRRIPKEKAIALIDLLCRKANETITLIGGPNDAAYTNEVIAGLSDSQRINNIAGKTSLPQLVDLFSRSKVLLSSDSGPAHLANATGLPVLVLFGAGDENETGPFYKAPSQTIRLGKLSCEPCRKNECKFKIPPPCLTDLDNELVIGSLLKLASQ
jgi:ADP-heptose:LPS heptosyltransferase